MKLDFKFKGNIKLKTPYGKVQVNELEWHEEETPEELKKMVEMVVLTMYGLTGDEEFKNFIKNEAN